MKHRYFTYEDRKRFEVLYENGASLEALAKTFEVNLSTIYRERKRGSVEKNGEAELDANGRIKYSADKAQSDFINTSKKRGKDSAKPCRNS